MSAVEYVLAALVAGAVVALAAAAREVARLARTAEMIYALLYYSRPAAAEEAPQAAEAAAEQQAAAQPLAAGGAPQQGGDECVVDLVRRYGCVSLADVKIKCGVGVYVVRRLSREGKIKVSGDRVCPKSS